MINKVIIELENLNYMGEKMNMMNQHLKIAYEKHKSYLDKCITFKEFKVGEHVLLKVKAKKSYLNLGSYKKLTSRYCDPFEIFIMIGYLAYELGLPPTIK